MSFHPNPKPISRQRTQPAELAARQLPDAFPDFEPDDEPAFQPDCEPAFEADVMPYIDLADGKPPRHNR